MKLTVFSLLIGAVFADFTYEPSGWRPTGPSFNPHDNRPRFNGYYNKPATWYGVPDVYPSISSTVNIDRTKTTQTTVTSTPRSREPTTQFNIDDDDDDDNDLQTNPAIAIANSFAFNKPVYIYSGVFPFNFGSAFVK